MEQLSSNSSINPTFFDFASSLRKGNCEIPRMYGFECGPSSKNLIDKGHRRTTRGQKKTSWEIAETSYTRAGGSASRSKPASVPDHVFFSRKVRLF